MSDPFLQSDGQTLKNRLGIFHDPEELRCREREYSMERAETVHDEVSGNFDAAHLRAIHGHIFQDVYEWAGTMRSDTILLEGEQIDVPAAIGALAKGSTVFMASAYVERGLAHVAALANSEAARSADPAVFADAATEVLDALNHVHPFREGNGRTQRAFMEQLAERAGHRLNFRGVTGERMILASIEAEAGDTGALRDILKESLDPARVALRLDAIATLERSGIEANDFWVATAGEGDHVEGSFLERLRSHVTVVSHDNQLIVLPPDALPDTIRQGDPVDLILGPAAREGAQANAADLDRLQELARQTWDRIEGAPPGAVRAQLAAELAEYLGDLPDALRSEDLRRLEGAARSASRSDDHDLDL
ncbi:MAG: Fic/DOC family protein [Alphaproteobacteria bacterium]